MEDEFRQSRVVAQGPTTRTVELSSGERVAFAPEALHGMLRQARVTFIPMNVEHLDLLPPIGRWNDGEVRQLDNGEQQLILYGEMLHQYEARGDITDPFAPDITQDTGAPTVLTLTVSAEPRNFDQETWAALNADCPYPLAETNKWSALPPLEWLLAIPVTWGAVRFAGSFLDRLGAATANALVDWLKRASNRAKESDRDRYVTLAFKLDDGRAVYGFVPVAADTDEFAVLHAALDQAGTLAEVAGGQSAGVVSAAHCIAYFYDGTGWQLGWFVTDEGAFRTKYFTDNAPDPERFLGGPLLPDGLPSSGSIGGRSKDDETT